MKEFDEKTWSRTLLPLLSRRYRWMLYAWWDPRRWYRWMRRS